jgi:tRNA 2-thiouridine synthesizing protein A
LRGEVCPYTFVRTRLHLEELPLGARLAILVDHEPAARNIPRSAREWGQEVEAVEALEGLEAVGAVERAGGAEAAQPARLWQIVLRKRVP